MHSCFHLSPSDSSLLLALMNCGTRDAMIEDRTMKEGTGHEFGAVGINQLDVAGFALV